MKRMWINQPSINQPLHKFHGVNVLTQDGETVYLLSGETISMMVPRNALSTGWRVEAIRVCDCASCKRTEVGQ